MRIHWSVLVVWFICGMWCGYCLGAITRNFGGGCGGPSAAGPPPPAAKPAPAAVSTSQAATGVAGCRVSATFPRRSPAIGPDGSERQLRRLLEAIKAVESGGKQYPKAGDGGKSIGRFQVQAGYWKDATEYGGVHWDWRTGAWDDAKCQRAILWYGARYGAKTPEEIARCHNSGPAWRSKYRLTNKYWRKVSAAMKGTDNGY